MNKENNFGIKLEDLTIFNQWIPNADLQNQDALTFIRDGIDLFEIPEEKLGMPLEFLEQQIPVDVVAGYIGLGHLLTEGHVPIKKEGKVSYNSLLSREPEDVFKAFVGFGFNYTGTRRMSINKSDSVKLKGTYQDRIKALSTDVREQFMSALKISTDNHYGRGGESKENPSVDAVFGLFQETYANKHGEEFWGIFDGGKFKRRKIISHEPGREGSLYVVRHSVYDSGRERYTCTCPDAVFRKRDCKHIDEVKST